MPIQSRVSLSVTALALVLGVAVAPRASASGFQLRDQSGSGQGNAYAGSSAGGSDISSMFFNPAALTRYEGNQLQFGLTEIMPDSKFSNGAASQPNVLPLTPPVGGTIGGATTTGNIAPSATLPTFYALWSVDSDFKLGISVNVPFGLTTQYDPNWAGRYQAIKTHLQTVDITPTVAYRMSPQWSMGAAVVARRASAELTRALDLGYVGGNYLAVAAAEQLKTFSNTNGGTPPAPIMGTGTADGSVDVKGSSWAYGFKLGLLFEPTPSLHIGLGYQSKVRETIRGTASFNTGALTANAGALIPSNSGAGQLGAAGIVGALDQLAPATANGAASAVINLPSTISLGIIYDVSSTFSLSAEFSDTKWSSFKELRVQFGNSAQQPDSVNTMNWKDAMFMALGATCHPGNDWTYRVGVALDKTPVPDGTRSPMIPDADRTWLSAGLGYQFTKSFSMDAGFTHLICKDSTVDLQGSSTPGTSGYAAGNLSGTYKNSINVLAVSARYVF